MKKILALLLAALMALALAGCGGNTETPAPTEVPATEVPAATEAPASEEPAVTEAPAEPEGDGAEDRVAGMIELVLSLKGKPVQELYMTPSACRPVRRNMLPAALSPAARTAYCPMTASRCTPLAARRHRDRVRRRKN